MSAHFGVVVYDFEVEFITGERCEAYCYFAPTHNHCSAYFVLNFACESEQFVDVFVGGGDIRNVSGFECIIASRNDNLMCTFDG